MKGNMTPMSLPATSPVSQYQQPNSAPRSYARAPPIRPYASPSLRRTNAKDAEGDTKKFGELVAQLVEDRSRRHRKGDDLQMDGIEEGVKQGAEGSLSGSWEKERAELIVDVPVWSPGCFQDLSTLHALRDTTLAHTHSLLAYLQKTHSLASSYRLLARSTVGATRHPVGWGCIRLAPSNSSPAAGRKELKPQIRRSSTSLTGGSGRRRSSVSPSNQKTQAWTSTGPEHAIVDEDDEDVEVHLKGGYKSGTGSDAEEDETADEIILRELEKRGAKEGSAFLMTVFGQPALILI